ncbi:hypothetical protein ACGFLS_30640 [Streptomyces abikoensis]|uniref:hypothetical protein n=1 Tax=Streptomyces abikoensis TaxID=97398 RepID=UPI0037138F1C
MAVMTDAQLQCVRYMHRNGGSVAQGDGYSLSTVRKLAGAGFVTLDEYVTDALYEGHKRTWIASLTKARLESAKVFSVEVPYGVLRWLDATRLMNPTERDMDFESDVTRAVRDAWRTSRGNSEARDGDMVFTAPLAVLTSVSRLAKDALGAPSPFNPLPKEEAQAFIDAVSALT